MNKALKKKALEACDRGGIPQAETERKIVDKLYYRTREISRDTWVVAETLVVGVDETTFALLNAPGEAILYG
jgi:hypothetical protein